jgi:hypothetical protein
MFFLFTEGPEIGTTAGVAQWNPTSQTFNAA